MTYTPFLNTLKSLVRVLLCFNNDVILTYALGWVIVFTFRDISVITLLSDNCPVILWRLDMNYELTMARYPETLTLEVGIGAWTKTSGLRIVVRSRPYWPLGHPCPMFIYTGPRMHLFRKRWLHSSQNKLQYI